MDGWQFFKECILVLFAFQRLQPFACDARNAHGCDDARTDRRLMSVHVRVFVRLVVTFAAQRLSTCKRTCKWLALMRHHHAYTRFCPFIHNYIPAWANTCTARAHQKRHTVYCESVRACQLLRNYVTVCAAARVNELCPVRSRLYFIMPHITCGFMTQNGVRACEYVSAQQVCYVCACVRLLRPNIVVLACERTDRRHVRQNVSRSRMGLNANTFNATQTHTQKNTNIAMINCRGTAPF